MKKPPSYERIAHKSGSCRTGIEWTLEHRQITQNQKEFQSNDSYWLFIDGEFIKSFLSENDAMFFLKGFRIGRTRLQEQIKDGQQ